MPSLKLPNGIWSKEGQREAEPLLRNNFPLPYQGEGDKEGGL